MKRRRRGPGDRGAVYLEFLIAFLPLLLAFEALLELVGLVSARLVLEYSAAVAARAAAVVLPDEPQHYGGVAVGVASGARREDIERAAGWPIRAISALSPPGVTMLRVGSEATVQRYAPDELIRVRVAARYRCRLPLVRRVVCRGAQGELELVAEATFPNQSASYVGI